MTDEQPIDVVRRFCEAWSRKDLDELIAFFSDDAVYHNIPLEPVVGPDQIRATIEGFSGGVEKIEFVVDAIAADGGTGCHTTRSTRAQPGICDMNWFRSK